MNKRNLLKIILTVLVCISAGILVIQNRRLSSNDSAGISDNILKKDLSGKISKIAGLRQLSDGSFVFHSATGTITPPFVCIDEPTAEGGSAIEIPSKAGKKDDGKVVLNFELANGGRYSLWVRAFWGIDGQRGCSNSIAVQVDKSIPVIVQDATYELWHWVQYRERGGVELSAGKHTLSLINREDGIRVDQVFLTPWFEDEFERRIPQGIE